MEPTTKQEELIINKSQLLEFFYNGCKPKNEFRIGIELEKPGVSALDYTAVPYSGPNGIAQFLRRYKKEDSWNYIYEDDAILGLANGCNTITLEPGSQLELSNCPRKNVHQLYDQINQYNSVTSRLAEDFDVYWLGYGMQPLSTFNDIELIPKKRYNIMHEYLPAKGDMALVMMKETAGVQVSIDYESREDAANKLKISLGISPFITAMFANSPIRAGKVTDYKSFRSIGWINTDNARCGLISSKVFEETFTFEDYVDILLDLPMIFLQKNNHWINMQGMKFRDYLNHGYEGYRATIDDWKLHKTSYFPDVRLNNYIEIRNCDCQRSNLLPAVPALWKGLLYNDDAASAAWNLVKDFSWEERLELIRQVPKYALDTVVNNIKVANIAKELVNIADSSLKSMPELNDYGQDESIYLEGIKELVSINKTPADIILDHWESDWNKNLGELIEYVRLS